MPGEWKRVDNEIVELREGAVPLPWCASVPFLRRRPRRRSKSFASSTATSSTRARCHRSSTRRLPGPRLPQHPLLPRRQRPGLAPVDPSGPRPARPRGGPVHQPGAAGRRDPRRVLRRPPPQLRSLARGLARSPPLAQLLPPSAAPTSSSRLGSARPKLPAERRPPWSRRRSPPSPRLHPGRAGAGLPWDEPRPGAAGAAADSGGGTGRMRGPGARWRREEGPR